jgi:predicted amidohydrolase
MRVAALQFDVLAGDPEANLAAVERGLVDARADGVDLVLLPEMWTLSFLPDERIDAGLERANFEAVDQVGRWSAELGLAVAGSALGPRRGPRDLPTNRLTLFDSGARAFEYDKLHLFTPTAETEAFAPGATPPPTVDCAGARVSGVVCYDLRFPELLRVPFRDGANLVLACAQWPTPRAAHWHVLIAARAVENQCFMLATNRTGSALIGRRKLQLDFPGNSLVVSPHGSVLAEGRGEPGLVSCDIDLTEVGRYRREVPVAKDERRDLYRGW